ncbi:carboxypeptidase regulatory-like domain-containing protein [Singulisphaera sp. PoT]|uniref:carboxypeptidase regulatory-like domain-containing protein n=1 Tax=Singulisphaera sp. PoT TaxID=3411797 RepID=UPI003BF5A822
MWNVAIPYVNSAAARWAAWMLTASLSAALLLAIVGLVWLVIRRRASPQVGYCLFLLVPLKLLLPVVVTVPSALAWPPLEILSSWMNSRQHVVTSKTRVDPRFEPTFNSMTTAVEPHRTPATSPATIANIEARPAVATPSIRPASVLAAQPLPRATPRFERLSIAAMFMLGWIASVGFLAIRFVVSQLRFRARLRGISAEAGSGHAGEVQELARLVGLGSRIRVVESREVPTASVWGILRPTILLPSGIAGSLSGPQLRWVLLHELAHVRRRDLLVAAFQRLATILHFFNPAIWVANRMIHQLREYACDDLALELSEASGLESGEAFVRMLRHFDRGRRRLEGALGVFGLDSRACCLRRVQRLIDVDRPIRTTPGSLSMLAILLFALVSVPHLRAANGPGSTSAEPPAPAKADAPKLKDQAATQAFTLQVVGPDGKPIPRALARFQTQSQITDKQVLTGKTVKSDPYRIDIEGDAEGRIMVEIQGKMNLDIYINLPGYGPYWAEWQAAVNNEVIPAFLKAELDAAWSVGGIVVDADGKPVEGVEVDPFIEAKKRPGMTRQGLGGSATRTDASGKWHYDGVPDSLSLVHFDFNHPSFKPLRSNLSRAQYGIERGKEPTEKLVMDRGLTVTGKVTDEAGKPIAGARVYTKFLNDLRETKTGQDGTYRLDACEASPTRLVVAAKGRATDMKEINVEAGMDPVDFAMKPGGKVRIRVVDMRGKPVPKARIHFQRWRGMIHYFEFKNVNEYADADGSWAWDEAPLDEFKADICPPDGMQLVLQPIIAREDEYVFRTPDTLVISGRVIDAESKKPVPKFRVVPGWQTADGRKGWNRNDSFVANDGQYRIAEDRGENLGLIRIEADGYEAMTSREIRFDEGAITIDFALKPGLGVSAKVVTPNLKPAVGARIALGIAGSQINIKDGDIDDGSTYASRETTDASGRFRFPAQDTDFQLIITHPDGFAHIKSKPEWDRTKIIRLEPWARVEGTFHIGKDLGINIPLTLNVRSPHSYGNDVASIFTSYEGSTGPDGKFRFDRVFPGPGSIGRSIRRIVGQGATTVASSAQVHFDFPAGKTLRINLGGTGRAVVGKLVPPDDFKGRVRWNLADVSLRVEDPNRQLSATYFYASADKDGSFRIDDVPEGTYHLNVRFDSDPPGHLFNQPLIVPQAEAGDDKPVDAGLLKLVKLPNRP